MVRGSVFGSESQACCFERDRRAAFAPVTPESPFRGWDKLTALHSRWRRSDSNKTMKHFTHTEIQSKTSVVMTS